MNLAVDVIDRCGSSDEMRHQLQPKKTKEDCISCYIAAKDVLPVLHYLQDGAL